MSTRELIDAIVSGDSQNVQSTFESEMMSRVAARMDVVRQNVAQNMFKTEQVTEAADQAKPPKSNELHVKHVGGGKYKVHAVGKNFADGIKAGEHLSDTELDDFHEMGGKVKHVK